MSPEVKENLFAHLLDSMHEHRDILDCLEYEVHERIYYYGAQFKGDRDDTTFLSKVSFFYKHAKILLYILAGKLTREKNTVGARGLSSSSHNYDQMLELEGCHIDRAPWSPRSGKSLGITFNGYLDFIKMDFRIQFYDFYDLVSSQNIVAIRNYKRIFKAWVKQADYKFLIVRDDLNFWSRLSLAVFKELGLPSISMAHGGTTMVYEGTADIRASHITMWGEMQANFHIQNGYDPEKISVTGHPEYKFSHQELRFSFDEILVVAKSMAGVVTGKKKFIEDRGNSIMYLMIIERVLKDLGIKSVSFRPHPSESYDWYSKFIDTKFFREDKKTLSNSLQASTLVIGPKSTVLVDAMAHGVNYVIFEPTYDGKDILFGAVTPPFDGSDTDFPAASNASELDHIIRNKTSIKVEALGKITKMSWNGESFTEIFQR
jgi:hypothetical protein